MVTARPAAVASLLLYFAAIALARKPKTSSHEIIKVQVSTDKGDLPNITFFIMRHICV